MKTINLFPVVLFLMFPIVGFTQAQRTPAQPGQPSADKNGNAVTPYYIDMNTAENFVFEVRGEYLHLKYNDVYGDTKTVPFTLFDWKGERLAQLTLVKEFGLNDFEINLQQQAIKLADNETYVCRLTESNGQKLECTFIYLPVVKKEIKAEILVKPVSLHCDDPLGQNLVEFYGNIEGGRIPYTVNWYVMNKERTDFLYQPQQFTMTEPGHTGEIQVDQSPEYYVLLYVKDACGNEATKTVQVVCEKNKKKVNTVFLQLSDTPPHKNGQ